MENLSEEIDKYFSFQMISNLITEELENYMVQEPPVQGQHIGISENIYHALKKMLDSSYIAKNLELEGGWL